MAGSDMHPKAGLEAEEFSLEDVKAGLADRSITLVDVREPHEYAAGHIPGVVLHPLSTFDPALLPEGKPIVFSCQSGKRSLIALRIAREAGRDDAAGHFAPGYGGWRNAGEDTTVD